MYLVWLSKLVLNNVSFSSGVWQWRWASTRLGGASHTSRGGRCWHLFNPKHSYHLPRFTMQTMTSRPLNGNTRGQDEGKQLEKTCLSVGREKFFLTIRYILPLFRAKSSSHTYCDLRLFMWISWTKRLHSLIPAWHLRRRPLAPQLLFVKSLTLEAQRCRFHNLQIRSTEPSQVFLGRPRARPYRSGGFNHWCQ